MAPRKPRTPETKPATAAKPEGAAKPAPDAALAKPVLTVVETVAPAVAAGGLKLKELVDQVAEATGSRKAEVKPVIEAALAAMATALAGGRAVAAPPLGKLRVVKSKGPALTLKLRLADAPKAAALALADDSEDG